MDARELTPQLLLQAYASGIFPMAEARDDPDVFWLSPEQRCVLPINGFHMSRSLAKALRKTTFEFRLNTDFPGVVAACADRDETWISRSIFDNYLKLHQMGHAHSQEVWDDGALVGGVYGVSLGGAFFGESMFSKRDNGSKMALAFLLDRLALTGFTLFDAQFMTPHLQSLGGREVPRAMYMKLLNNALNNELESAANIGALDAPQTPYDVVQRSTQTS